jgi:predicted glycosyltransferase
MYRMGREGAAPASDAGGSTRFLFYSHDGLGLGHVRRNLCIAGALSESLANASILVATSAEEAELFGLAPRVDLLKLPGLRKIDNFHYASRRLPMRWEEIHRLRAELFAAAVESFRPTVLLVDKHPFGVGEELLPALETARAAGARSVLGIRDVLDDPAAVEAEWRGRRLFERIPDYYERILVYGQRDVLDPRRVYGFPGAVADLTRFCGYVASGRNGGVQDDPALVRTERPLVLAMAGGGEDGYALLAAFIEASAGGGWDGIAVSGPQCPPKRVQSLRALAAVAGVPFRRFIPQVSLTFPTLDALVAMGGYGTLVEALASGVPTICVPRTRPRCEQLIRARAFAERGLLRLVDPGQLSPERLRGEVDAALATGRHDAGGNGSLDLSGARRAAAHLSELAADPNDVRRLQAFSPE